MISSDVLRILRARYRPPEWLLFPEVRSVTGATHGSFADAVAMNVWPSGGLEVHGFEIKVSRGDWLRELKRPEKSAGVRRFCDRWWLAVSEVTIVKPGELPETWGLIVVVGGAGRVARKAPKLVAEAPDRTFLASMLRAGHDAQKVEERQAQKGALLAAPLRTITDMSSGKWTLSCGHVVMRGRPWPLPKSVRCLECAGAPAARSEEVMS